MESMSKLANYSLGGCKGGLANWKKRVFPFRKSRRRRQYAICKKDFFRFQLPPKYPLIEKFFDFCLDFEGVQDKHQIYKFFF